MFQDAFFVLARDAISNNTKKIFRKTIKTFFNTILRKNNNNLIGYVYVRDLCRV